MRILYLLTRELDATAEMLRQQHAREHALAVIDLRTERDFDRVVEEIAAADRVICW